MCQCKGISSFGLSLICEAVIASYSSSGNVKALSYSVYSAGEGVFEVENIQ